MKAWRLRSPGWDGLQPGELPEPPPPGRGQVLVRLRAASTNTRDLMVVQGAFGPGMPPGQVPLSDGAGEVMVVGAVSPTPVATIQNRFTPRFTP